MVWNIVQRFAQETQKGFICLVQCETFMDCYIRLILLHTFHFPCLAAHRDVGGGWVGGLRHQVCHCQLLITG